MGGTISRLRGHLLTRPLQRYNIEARTEKLLDRDRPTPAPRYTSDLEQSQQQRQSHPEVAEAVVKKDEVLHKRLKEVFVTSQDPVHFNPDSLKQAEDPSRPLPRKLDPAYRWLHEDKHGFSANDLTPAKKGKMTLASIQELLNLYQEDTKKNNAAAMAKKYEIALADSRDLLEHFVVLSLFKKENKTPRYEKPLDPLLPGSDWEEARPEERGLLRDLKDQKDRK